MKQMMVLIKRSSAKFCELEVDFPKPLCNKFFNNSANVNKVVENDIFRKLVLFVSGGFDPNIDCDSSRFVCLLFNERKINFLQNMIEPRSNHSMIDNGTSLYVVGGNDKNTCEKYNLKKNEWTKMPNLISGERRNPGLIVYQEFLYAFFGSNKIGCLDTIERICINSMKPQWEILPYKRTEKMNLGRYGFAIFPIKNKKTDIFLLGGKNDSENLDSILKFDFKEACFTTSSMNLARKSFFRESQLVKLSDDYYGHFDNDQLNNILRLN
jgi:hypothetical protein